MSKWGWPQLRGISPPESMFTAEPPIFHNPTSISQIQPQHPTISSNSFSSNPKIDTSSSYFASSFLQVQRLVISICSQFQSKHQNLIWRSNSSSNLPSNPKIPTSSYSLLQKTLERFKSYTKACSSCFTPSPKFTFHCSHNPHTTKSHLGIHSNELYFESKD